MMRFFSKIFLFLIVSVFVCSCSGDSSSSSKVNGPDAGDSSSSEELSSGAVVDTVVEYVEPPTLSCELVEYARVLWS